MATTRIYDVRGMTCDHCKGAVKEAVQGIDGVTDVLVDLKTGKVSVTFAHSIKDDQVDEAVEEAGYQVV